MQLTLTKTFRAILSLVVFVAIFGVYARVEAATLSINPSTGVYTVGSPFTVSVRVNTAGAAVNAADAQISFNPRELQVVSVSRANSVFNLWTQEPTFSNSAGTISFGGGSPSGYSGSSGVVMTATFRALGAGSPRVQFSSGSVLAADGQGTNVLTAMNGGAFTIAAAQDAPAPEYIPPANTPQAPVVRSSTHPDPAAWYKETTARLSWTVPSGVTAVRTLLDRSPGTVPTIVYDEPITERELTDLPQGISYFHIQFRNADGWGRIAHYRLAVDSESPRALAISELSSGDGVQGKPMLQFVVEDTSPIREFKVQIGDADPIMHPSAEGATTTFELPSLAPGYHAIRVEAIDSAGNSRIETYGLTLNALPAPVFTEAPTRLTNEIVPVFQGSTIPNASVFLEITRIDTGMRVVEASTDFSSAEPHARSDGEGGFTYIGDAPLDVGVYEVRAIARDQNGRMSEYSEPVRLLIEVPGFIAFGTAVVRTLSVLIPLIALILMLGFGTWYLWHRLSVWKRRVSKETIEAENQLSVEFKALLSTINTRVDALKESRKTKLTRAEVEVFDELKRELVAAEERIAKEIGDIEKTLK